jgi:hypothetical protein
MHPRRSTRLSAKTRTVAGTNKPTLRGKGRNSSGRVVQGANERTGRKRLKTADESQPARRGAGGKSKPKIMEGLPLEIVIMVCSRSRVSACADPPCAQIFSSLHPMDLLHLAWTARSVRSLLMSREQRSLWQITLSNVAGLPECPPDLTEPQWTYLAFYPHCHVRNSYMGDRRGSECIAVLWCGRYVGEVGTEGSSMFCMLRTTVCHDHSLFMLFPDKTFQLPRNIRTRTRLYTARHL